MIRVSPVRRGPQASCQVRSMGRWRARRRAGDRWCVWRFEGMFSSRAPFRQKMVSMSSMPLTPDVILES